MTWGVNPGFLKVRQIGRLAGKRKVLFRNLISSL